MPHKTSPSPPKLADVRELLGTVDCRPHGLLLTKQGISLEGSLRGSTIRGRC
ncbi:hypothetical protein AXF42_Ash002247 [Apostasia shenzhenica]|uniref:Uncharacterized protein n=1 Tax=Apostasia shenzhenica TaxID=1088818 RepID=A0A2I0AN14_9ASPA|nr:hypothetical protein AXF42_Ash002247 [Apostasia shenzhenica]